MENELWSLFVYEMMIFQVVRLLLLGRGILLIERLSSNSGALWKVVLQVVG